MSGPLSAGTVPGEAARTLRHTLRTPVNHIVGYSELLLEDAVAAADAGFAAGLTAIHDDAMRALTLIDDAAGHAQGEDASRQAAARELAVLATALVRRCTDLRQTDAGGATGVAPDLEKIAGAARQLAGLVSSLAPVVAAGAAASPQHSAGTVLVVDDNELNRDMLSRRVQRLGYTVLLAGDGREALDLLQRESVDVLLLDIVMPELDGFAVLERLQADDRLRDVPVIMISAIDEIESVARCITLGAEDYLPKPFNAVLLKARLDACLEKKRRRDGEAAYRQALAQLTDAATAVDAGTYAPEQLAGVAARPDQLGQLARVFQRMAAGVQAREERLRAQITERGYVFLSYASADRERALAVAARLEQAGVRVWVDRHDISAGASWSAEIVQSVRGCAALLVACTPAAMESRNVRQEIQLAWKYGRPYLPLILDRTEFPDEVAYQLEGWQWIDLLDNAHDVWLPTLLHALERMGIPASASG